MPDWVGQTIGKVRIDKFLARGGMAEVYLGTHLTLDRPVAVKVMHSFVESEPDLLARFQREAKVVAALRHPNIVQVLDFDTHEGHPYIVMEYLQGASLASYLRGLHTKNEKLALPQIGRLLAAIASAIDYAHGQGVIHRDIKPANILLHARSAAVTDSAVLPLDVQPVITDFGLVRIAHSASQTASGLVSGTAAYMSPEQARGDRVDERTDIYSLGIVLYEMLAGRVPFEGDSTMTVIYKHIHDAPPPIESISPKLQQVISKVLAKDPKDRQQSARALAADFYEAIDMQAEAQTLYTAQTPRRAPSSVTKERPRLNGLWLGLGIGVCACLAIFCVSVFGLTSLSGKGTPAAAASSGTAPASGYASMPDVPAVLRFQDGTAELDQITISADLIAPSASTHYEAWLLSDSGEQRKSLGILKVDAGGKFTLKFVDPQSRNLLDGFNRMEITVEPEPDDSPNPSGLVAYSSAIPAGALTHIRHLLVHFDTTPNHVGMVNGLLATATLIKQSADALVQAHDSGNAAAMRSNAEAIINLIVGKQSLTLYKDWDKNNRVNDPGDGFGLLLNADQEGYIGGTIDHAKLAAEASDSTAEIRLHAGHVEICAQNVQEWAIQLRDAAMHIVQAAAAANIDADVQSVKVLSNDVLAGIDINGNEQVDPIPGEGGAFTAYIHAEYMSDMPILQGADQIPSK